MGSATSAKEAEMGCTRPGVYPTKHAASSSAGAMEREWPRPAAPPAEGAEK